MSTLSHHRNGSSSTTTTNRSIISLDPTTPLNAVPLIADILRTRYCVPGSVFLVERIERFLVGGEGKETEGRASTGRNGEMRGHQSGKGRRKERVIRLLLGDGELCVQALVRPEIHCFLDAGVVYEGGYVRLDRFELKVLEDGGWGGKERKKGRVVYLVVGDMVTVGWNAEYMRLLRMQREGRNERGGARDIDVEVPKTGLDGAEEEDTRPEARGDDQDTNLVAVEDVNSRIEPCLDEGPPGAPNNPPDDPADSDFDTDEGTFETLTISAERVARRRAAVPINNNQPDPRQAVVARPNHLKPHNPKARPWISNDPTQPLRLTPLRAIPHLPYKQNWMVNVLAVVVSLSGLEPSHLGPSYVQRTARLADPSTPRRVHLTVVLDPHEFTPRVGSVVLLLGVKNHMFDGGSLRKYVSDRPKNGTSWWIQHPEALGWCDEDVRRLREWWEKKKEEEKEEGMVDGGMEVGRGGG
ncbi:hypothetical protein VTK26DRAFT_3748 [Humicola hyalothermophila]